MAADSASQRYSSAYAIFEGGGVKALAHVGALKALEEVKLALVGVAGTSAGAIIAALVAVGYEPDEIFLSSNDNILSRLNLSGPIELLGQDKWNRFQSWKVRSLFILLVNLSGLAVLLFKGVIAGYVTLIIPGFGPLLSASLINAVAIALLVISIVWAVREVWPLIRDRGLFKSDIIRDTVNLALKRKLEEYKAQGLIDDDIPDVVLFEHIDPARIPRCIPLKVVATNVTDGELTLFDHRTKHIPVGDAVAASAALPFVFCPTKVRGFTTSDAEFADGGLVSNMPSWVFRDEKRARERLETRDGGRDRVPIYAFELHEKQVASAARHSRLGAIWPYIRKVLTAGIFGGQTIIQKFVPDLRVIQLEATLATMAFDCSGSDAEEAVAAGRASAADFLGRERLTEDLTNRVLTAIHEKVCAAITENRGREAPRIRIALIDPVTSSSESDVVGFRVVAGANMNDDSDDALELDVNGSIAPAAFKENRAIFGEIGTRTPAELLMTKYERALLPQGLHSVIALPIYALPTETQRPRRVLAVDSSDDLRSEFESKPFMDTLVGASASASRKLIQDAVGAIMAREFAGEPHAQADLPID